MLRDAVVIVILLQKQSQRVLCKSESATQAIERITKSVFFCK